MEIVALIAGMPLHGMGVVAGIQMLQAEGYPLLLGISDDLLEARHAVVDTLIGRNLTAGGIFGIAPLVTREGDDIRKPRLRTSINGSGHAGDQFFVIAGIVESLHEGSTRHAVRGQ